MKYSILLGASLLSLTSCARLFEPEHFGVKESVWNTLSEECKQKAIEGYNERKRRQQEINAEYARRQQEIDAKNAPYEFALKVAEAIATNDSPSKIAKVDTLFNRVTLQNNISYSIESRVKLSDWKKGDKVIVYKDKNGIYDYVIENKDTGDSVRANKR